MVLAYIIRMCACNCNYIYTYNIVFSLVLSLALQKKAYEGKFSSKSIRRVSYLSHEVFFNLHIEI